MPPRIGCRTCSLLMQSAMLEPVSEENAKSVVHVRYCAGIVLLAVVAFFIRA